MGHAAGGVQDGVDTRSSRWQIERCHRDGQKNLAKAFKAVGACSAWSPRRRFEESARCAGITAATTIT
eukprot:5389797-Pyramimonas_sp.AAC.1